MVELSQAFQTLNIHHCWNSSFHRYKVRRAPSPSSNPPHEISIPSEILPGSALQNCCGRYRTDSKSGVLHFDGDRCFEAHSTDVVLSSLRLPSPQKVVGCRGGSRYFAGVVVVSWKSERFKKMLVHEMSRFHARQS